MNYRLRRLTIHDEAQFENYRLAWQDEPRMVPNSANLNGATYQSHLSMLLLREQGLYQPEVYVPDKTYVMVDQDDVFYGILNLRLKLNEHLLAYDGHIGYGIHPLHRKEGLGKEILRLGLEKAKKHGIDQVLLSCDEDNIASKKVILSCGGIFENKVYKTDGYILRYWIDLR